MNDDKKKEAEKKVAEAMMKVSGATVKQPPENTKPKYRLPAGQATIGVRG